MIAVTSKRTDIHIPKKFDKEEYDYNQKLLSNYLSHQAKEKKKLATQVKKPEDYYEEKTSRFQDFVINTFKGFSHLTESGKSIISKLSKIQKPTLKK
uniref:Uncharacterized protein n=1 Tax=Acrobeloides nanus TaxID=290746 RepID=A0A914CUR4_9BILA